MEIAYALCLPRDEVTVPVIRHLCSVSLEELGVEESCAYDIGLAITEACTNVLRHARDDHDYEVRVRVLEGDCEISVRDGGDFGSEPSPDGDVSLVAEGGRGLTLMRALVDDLEFDDDGDGVVRMRKALDLAPKSVLGLLSGA